MILMRGGWGLGAKSCDDARHILNSSGASAIMETDARYISRSAGSGGAKQIGCTAAGNDVIFRITTIFKDASRFPRLRPVRVCGVVHGGSISQTDRIVNDLFYPFFIDSI